MRLSSPAWRSWALCSQFGCRRSLRASSASFSVYSSFPLGQRSPSPTTWLGCSFSFTGLASSTFLASTCSRWKRRRLDLLFVEPLTRAEHLWAKLVPILILVIALFTIGALAHWLALRAAGLAYPIRALAGANFALLGWTILLVCLVNLGVMWARDTYTALLIAFVPVAVTILPGTIYMYRPDIFEAHHACGKSSCFP